MSPSRDICDFARSTSVLGKKKGQVFRRLPDLLKYDFFYHTMVSYNFGV
jgi:hypothetical protein